MTAYERRSSQSLALLFALRMLGLFIVLPVFALEVRKYPGGDDPALVGLAMGMYGLTQACLQIPYGLASDRWGRKPVMLVGLTVFVLGSVLAAMAPTLGWLAAGRGVQGAGAISAAVTALLADQTRELVRTKAMALIGASIGLVFSLSLVLSPLLDSILGLRGLFLMTATLALGGVAVVIWWVPAEPPRHPARTLATVSVDLRFALMHPALLRLNFGVFVLHAVQLAMWMAIPAMLIKAGIAKEQHWQCYLVAVLGSFVVMGATLFPLERRGHLRAVFLSAIGAIALVQLSFALLSALEPGVVMVTGMLFAFFCGFNILEASQPSLVSKLAPAPLRGTALGVYNTLQSLGFFAGGALGGELVKRVGVQSLFATCAGAMVLWLWLAWPMRVPLVNKPLVKA